MDLGRITQINPALEMLGTFIKVHLFTTNNLIVYFQNGSIFLSYEDIIAIKLYNHSTILVSDYQKSTTTGRYRNKYLGYDLKELKNKIKRGEVVIDDTYSKW